MMEDQKEIKKKHRLKDITFDHEGAAISLVGPLVGGPANQQPTVIWKSKSTSHITDQDVKSALEKSAEDVLLEKAKFNSEVKQALTSALEAKFAERWEWLYLEDFSEDQVVFSADSGMYVVGYSLSSDGEYVFDDIATGVEWTSILVENDKVKLSAEAQAALKQGEYSLVNKALTNPETNDRIIKSVNTFNEKVKEKMDEIEKAVNAVKEEKDKIISDLQKQLTDAQALIAEVEAAKKEAVMKSRKERIEAFDKEGAEDLVKATESLDDAAFDLIVKSFESKQKVVEESNLFKQTSDPHAQEKQEDSATFNILKAQYNIN